jgi:hypothetical protein
MSQAFNRQQQEEKSRNCANADQRTEQHALVPAVF